MSVTINGTTGIDTIQDGIVTTAKIAADAVTTPKIADTVNLGRRNLIINGAMQVAQRYTSVTEVNYSDDGYWTADRWKNIGTGTTSAKVNISQETDAPSGFKYSTKFAVHTTDTAIITGESWRVEQHIEAGNLRHLNWTLSNTDAKEVTLSFWVKSNKTGSWSVGLYMDSTSGGTDTNKENSQSYTINSAGTWEYKTLTFSGNTSTNMNSVDNDHGLRVWFHLMASSDITTGTANTWAGSENRAIGQSINLFDDAANYWQFTGVQLEVGDTATPFEHRSYGEELELCKRYFEKINYVNTEFVALGVSNLTTASNASLSYTEKRVAPTINLPNAGQGSGNISYLTSTGGYPSATGDHSIQVANTKQCRIYGFSYTGLTAGGPSFLYSTGATSISIDAEL